MKIQARVFMMMSAALLMQSVAFAQDTVVNITDPATGKSYDVAIPYGSMDTTSLQIIAGSNADEGQRASACKILGGSMSGGQCAGGSFNQQAAVEAAAANGSEAAAEIAGGGEAAGAAGEDQETGACQTPTTAARMACDPLSYTGLSGEQSSMIESVLTTGATAATALSTAGGSANQQCGKAADLAKIMGIIQGARAGACLAAQRTCVSRCNTYIETHTQPQFAAQVAQAKKNRKQCENYSANFAQQIAQVMAYATTFTGAAMCQNLTDSSITATTPTPVDCTNSANATLAVCICQNNPRDPYCIGGTRTDTGGGVFTGGGDSGGGKFSDSNFGSTEGFEDDTGGVSNPVQAKANSTSGVPQNGGGGPSPFGGGGGGGYAGGDGGGAGGGGNPSSLITGVSGGTGGGSGYGGRSSGGEGGGGSSRLLNALKDKFNIKDALPGRDKRGLAGMSGDAAADGITSANGPTIWEKVSRQYRKKTSELITPKN